MDSDILVLDAPFQLDEIRFGGLMCLRPGVVSVHLGRNANALALIRPYAADARDVWTPGGFVLPVPELYVNVISGQFAVLLPRPQPPKASSPY